MQHSNILSSFSASGVQRTGFVRRVYAHLFLAIAAFVGLEVVWFSTDVADSVLQLVSATSWLLVLGAFMVVAWLASRLANSNQSSVMQYAGLLLYVLIESLIFVPVLAIAAHYGGMGAIASSAVMTLGGFAALTGVVMYTKIDMSSWSKYLAWAGIVALMAIVSSIVFGFELGTWFSVAMVGFAGLAILRDTSAIMHSHDDNSVAAATLQLFASVALMFWYLLRLSSRD